MERYIDADRFEKEIKLEASESIANAVVRILDRQPTADVAEVKHGKWVHDQTTKKIVCSECGAPRPFRKSIHFLAWYSKCCPECGAAMDGNHGSK